VLRARRERERRVRDFGFVGGADVGSAPSSSPSPPLPSLLASAGAYNVVGPEARSSSMACAPGSAARRGRALPPSPLSQSTSSPSTSPPSSSESRVSELGPFGGPVSVPRLGDDVNTQTIVKMCAIVPSSGLLRWPHEVEKDDALHDPGPDGPDGSRWEGLLSWRVLGNCFGLIFIIVVFLCLFVVYPAS
jgi:hypothetical protein